MISSLFPFIYNFQKRTILPFFAPPLQTSKYFSETINQSFFYYYNILLTFLILKTASKNYYHYLMDIYHHMKIRLRIQIGLERTNRSHLILVKHGSHFRSADGWESVDLHLPKWRTRVWGSSELFRGYIS